MDTAECAGGSVRPLPGKVTYGASFAGRADCREKVSINAGTAVARLCPHIASNQFFSLPATDRTSKSVHDGL